MRRPYPFVPEDFDLQSVCSRICFHLHAMALPGKELSLRTGLPISDIHDFMAGRRAFDSKDAAWLAAALGVDEEALLTPLTHAHELEWGFYRISARHPVALWQTAHALWQDGRLTERDVAAVVGLHRRAIMNVVLGKRTKPILLRGQAQALLQKLNRTETPEDLLVRMLGRER